MTRWLARTHRRSNLAPAPTSTRMEERFVGASAVAAASVRVWTRFDSYHHDRAGNREGLGPGASVELRGASMPYSYQR